MGDKLFEDDETFELGIISNMLPNEVTVGNLSKVIVTIMDNDGKLSIYH